MTHMHILSGRRQLHPDCATEPVVMALQRPDKRQDRSCSENASQQFDAASTQLMLAGNDPAAFEPASITLPLATNSSTA
jgi:hypothetical protein